MNGETPRAQPVSWGEGAYDFAFDAEWIADSVLSGGSGLGPDGMWTDGDLCSLTVPGNERADVDRIFALRCGSPGPEWPQTADVYVNGFLLARWRVDTIGWQEVFVPAEAHHGRDCVVLIALHDPVCLAELGISDDFRQLGLLLKDLRVKEAALLPPTTNPELLGLEGGFAKSSGLDDAGPTTEVNVGFARAFRGPNAVHLKLMIWQGILALQVERRLVPGVTVTQSPDQVVLVSERCDTPPIESYPWSKFIAAARTWVALNRLLVGAAPGRVSGTSDGHYGNFVTAADGLPVWCDFGSRSSNWIALENGTAEFVRHFLLPMALVVEDGLSLADFRGLIHRYHHEGGVPLALSDHVAVPFSTWLAPSSPSEESRLTTLAQLDDFLDAAVDRTTLTWWPPDLDDAFRGAAWAGELLGEEADSRYRLVCDAVRATGARHALDIGAGVGAFSLLCAREGLHVSAVDPDEGAMDRLFRFVSAQEWCPVQTIVGDLARCDVTSELVLALDLIHFLASQQELSLDVCARHLARLTTKDLLVDFRPGVGDSEGLSINDFRRALEGEFERVEPVPDPYRKTPEHLLLFSCSGPRESGPSAW